MALHLRIHPDNPQARLVNQAVAALRAGALVVYPTDSTYALGCLLADRPAQERIRRLRQLRAEHELTIVCRDLSEVALYARVDNPAYRLLRALTPGAYTFVLPASREVPRRLQDPKRRTVGLRVPDHRVTATLLEALGEPLMSSTLHLPGDEYPLNEPDDIIERVGNQIDVLIDAGTGDLEPTTIIDLVGPEPVVVRRGRGPTAAFER